MKSTCATPKLQRAHFQCLINLCSPESYGRALAYSVSACCDTGVDIIPLHPIEISQPSQHKRSLQSEVSDKTHTGDKFTSSNQEIDLKRNLAVALTCNTGQDGVITVSVGSPQASKAPASMVDDEALLFANGFMTTALSHGRATMSLHKPTSMDESRGHRSDSTTDCESSNGSRRTTSVTTMQAQSTPCKSTGSSFRSTPTTTICGSFEQDMSMTSQTYPSASCTQSGASKSGVSRDPAQVTSLTESGRRTSQQSTSGCTSSSSHTDATSRHLPSEKPNAPTTDCSDDIGRSTMSTRPQTSTQESWTLDSHEWSTSRLSSSDTPCSSDLARSSVFSRQGLTLTSAVSRTSITSTSCTASGRSSSSSFAHSDSTSSSSSIRAGTSRDRYETACTTNTMSSTTSSTFTTSSSSEGNFAATPAAYTFASPSSLPPAYTPPLEEYGYGTPPPVYDFPSQGNGVDEPRSSRISYPTSSPDQHFSSRSGTQDGSPAAYDTSMARPTKMAHAAPAHDQDTNHDKTALQDTSSPVEVTLISSVLGKGFQTTIITVNEAGATSLTMPLALALNSPVDGRPDSTTSESKEGSGTSHQNSGPSDELNNSSRVGFESPMPAFFVGGSVTTDPSIYVLISTVSLAAGIAICIL
ncbi:hypothetical protein J3458_009203 [Metarhizium acridum]|uniref:uncharacterized protein n=1 Tax=Metarhizium acridum TaxID=92637 RepID=UPI001C6B9829|nr:hypothetical protein J3458_009203 [Metarhizium acridum]